ncbi:hypothetical protein HK102_011908 [Quaeritorhiza haematococci]|nr:hypothetical protein HK102_011908 [Quaeritorhiza haematococci]
MTKAFGASASLNLVNSRKPSSPFANSAPLCPTGSRIPSNPSTTQYRSIVTGVDDDELDLFSRDRHLAKLPPADDDDLLTQNIAGVSFFDEFKLVFPPQGIDGEHGITKITQPPYHATLLGESEGANENEDGQRSAPPLVVHETRQQKKYWSEDSTLIHRRLGSAKQEQGNQPRAVSAAGTVAFRPDLMRFMHTSAGQAKDKDQHLFGSSANPPPPESNTSHQEQPPTPPRIAIFETINGRQRIYRVVPASTSDSIHRSASSPSQTIVSTDKPTSIQEGNTQGVLIWEWEHQAGDRGKIGRRTWVEKVVPVHDLMAWLRTMFLPIGYPQSVSVLCNEAMLESLGVSSGAATTGAVAIQWVLKDGFGEIGKLIFIERFAKSFDSHPKCWKLVGEVSSLCGSLISMCTVVVEPRYFLPMASLGYACRSVHFAIWGATHMTFTRNFALNQRIGGGGGAAVKELNSMYTSIDGEPVIPHSASSGGGVAAQPKEVEFGVGSSVGGGGRGGGNVGDIVAKDDSQMSVAHIVGMLCGVALLSFSHSPWFLFACFLAVLGPTHFLSTVALLKAAKFQVLNGATMGLVAMEYVESWGNGGLGVVPSLEELLEHQEQARVQCRLQKKQEEEDQKPLLQLETTTMNSRTAATSPSQTATSWSSRFLSFLYRVRSIPPNTLFIGEFVLNPDRQKLPDIKIGSTIKDAYSDAAQLEMALESMRFENYLISGSTAKSDPIHIVLHTDAGPFDVLKAVLHATKYHADLPSPTQTPHQLDPNFTTPSAPADHPNTVKSRLATSLDWTTKEFPRFIDQVEDKGWQTDTVFWRDAGNRVTWDRRPFRQML